MDAMHPFLRPPPSTLGAGRYALAEAVGHGGMAIVYRASDSQTGEDVALKLLNPVAATVEKARTRFLTEARTMAQLSHANIVRVRDIGEENGYFWFTMDLAQHGSMHRLMRRAGPADPLYTLNLVFQLLMGLEHAHRAGVVHRDVKPHNMLLFAPDDVRLTDFGIARVASTKHAGLTGTGDTLGTIAYMAPEQRLDPRRVGPVADLFGVGATLYVLLTGRRPLDLALSKLEPSVLASTPEALRHVIRRATAQRPDDRFPSARSMALACAEAWEAIDETVRFADLVDRFDDSVGIASSSP